MEINLKNAFSCCLTVGVLGHISSKYIGINHTIADTIFFAAMIISLLGSNLFNWSEQRSKHKGNGKRAVYIASTAYFIFIVAICIWAILDKLGIL